MTALSPAGSVLLAALRRRAADRRAHADYLESLIEDATGCVDPRHLTHVLDDVRVPRGLTRPYAFALADDVQWIFTAAGTSPASFPDTYRSLRDCADRAAERGRARRSVAHHPGPLQPH
jgi:hypothetical protein